MSVEAPDKLHAFLSQIATVIRDKTDSEALIEGNQMVEKIAGIGGAVGGVMVSKFEINNLGSIEEVFTEGELIDYTKLTASITLENGFTLDVTNDELEFSPEVELTIDDEYALISYDWGGQHLVYAKPIKVFSATDLDGVTSNLPETLEECSFGVISMLSSGGVLVDYYPIGSTKSLTLDKELGYVGENVNASMVLIGYNHNKELESPDYNLAHFMLNYDPVSEHLYVQYDQYDGQTITNGTKCFQINAANRTSGGWASSDMRVKVLGNGEGSTPLSPMPMSFLAGMPYRLRRVMRAAAKWTNNLGGSAVPEASAVTATEDYISLPTAFETSGDIGGVAEYEHKTQLRYDFFKSKPASDLYFYKESLTASTIWTRSPTYRLATDWCVIGYDGRLFTSNVRVSNEITPIFFI